MRAPQRGDAIEQRQRGVGILGDIAHREVVVDEGVHQHADGERDEHELAAGRRGRRARSSVRAPVAGPARPKNACAAASSSARISA